MGTVIGPIDHATWYCMRQCNESIRYLTPLVAKNPIYETEIKGEKELLRIFKEGIFAKNEY